MSLTVEVKYMVYPVYTVSSGTITVGAIVEKLHLKSAGIDVPAVLIGELGRGRERGVMPVGNPPIVPCPERGKDVWTSAEKCEKCDTALGEKKENSRTRLHPDQGQVLDRLMFAEIGQTKKGGPKLISGKEATSNESVIVVFRTKIGFRGGNTHTGDRCGWLCRSCDATGSESTPEVCPTCGKEKGRYGTGLRFAEFPGDILVRGCIAQGDAGAMGSGEQLIALMPKGTVFRTEYLGRLYGDPPAHYYLWDGENLLSATWKERVATDLF